MYSPTKKSSLLDPGRLLHSVATTSLPDDISLLKPDEIILQGYLKRTISRDGTARIVPTVLSDPTITSSSNIESLYNNGNGIEGKRRWFVLTKSTLSWRKSQEAILSSSSSSSSSSVLKLSEIVGLWALKNSEDDILSPPNSFALRSPGNRVMILQAPLDAAKRQWLTAIAGALLSLQNQQKRDAIITAQLEREKNAEQKRNQIELQRQLLEQQLDSKRRGSGVSKNNTKDGNQSIYLSTSDKPRLDITALAGLPLSSLTEEEEDKEEDEEEIIDKHKHKQGNEKKIQHGLELDHGKIVEKDKKRGQSINLLSSSSSSRDTAVQQKQHQQQQEGILKHGGSSRAARASNALALLTAATSSSSVLLKKEQPLTNNLSSSQSILKTDLATEQREMISKLAKEAVEAYVLSSNSTRTLHTNQQQIQQTIDLVPLQSIFVASDSTERTSSPSSPPSLSQGNLQTSISTSTSTAYKNNNFLSTTSSSPISPRSVALLSSVSSIAAVGNLNHATPAAVQMRRRLMTISPCPPLKGTEPGGIASSFKPLPFAKPSTLTAKAAEDLMKRRERLTKLAIDFANAANGGVGGSSQLIDEEIVNRIALVWASERALKDLLSGNGGEGNSGFSNSSSLEDRSWKTLGN